MRWTGQIFWLLASPSSRLHRTVSSARLALGKSYPVTAAQLLPIYTGFLAPIHDQLTKNYPGNRRFRTGRQEVILFHLDARNLTPYVSG